MYKNQFNRNYRAEAEELLRRSPRDIGQMTDEDIQRLVHELQVHQIQLQMQNEELRTIQEQLEESRDRLADLYDFAPTGYLTLNAQKKIVEANLTAATLLGIERGRLIGKRLSSFIAPEHQDKFYLQCRMLFGVSGTQYAKDADPHSPVRHTCELKMINLRGKPLYCRLECIMHQPGFDNGSGISESQTSGSVLCRIALIDITAGKLAEEARQETESKLRIIADTVPDILYLCDDKGQREYVSRQFYQFTGMPFGSAEGNGWQHAVHPDDLERLLVGQRIAQHRCEPWEGRFRLRSADGLYHWFMGRSRPFPVTGSHSVKWLGCDTDIDQLIHTEQMLQEADRRKDEFLAMLAHELRNPLAPIRNAAQLLHVRNLDESRIAWVRDLLERNVAHMVRLVDDLLDTSRITNGTIMLQKQRQELAAILERAVETARPLFTAKKHHLQIDIPAQPIALEGDFVRLTQVFTNILNNAAKYTAEGGHIRLQAEAENAFAVVTIRDDGMGIEASLLEHVFDLFRQDERGLDRSQGGLGIGLTLVKKLVELHGGNVTAYSNGHNRGSEFAVRLPRIAGAEAQPPHVKATANANAASCRQQILLVEDNADVAQSLASLLQMYGHEVKIAADGQQGLALAQQFKPDAVLLDIGIPGMNGYQLAERLRALDKFHDTLIVALSGYGQSPENEQRAAICGIDHYLVKPADFDRLLDLLNKTCTTS